MGSMAESLAWGKYGWHDDDCSEADARQIVQLLAVTTPATCTRLRLSEAVSRAVS
jgi:hypothetical protein